MGKGKKMRIRGASQDKDSVLESSREEFITVMAKEFPQLDETLITAIASDYDCVDPKEREQIRASLQQLASEMQVDSPDFHIEGDEESGVSSVLELATMTTTATSESAEHSPALMPISLTNRLDGDNPVEEVTYQLGGTNITENSIILQPGGKFKATDTNPTHRPQIATQEEPATDEEKLAQLCAIFPKLDKAHVQKTLKDNNADMEFALNALLTEEYLANEPPPVSTTPLSASQRKRARKKLRKSELGRGTGSNSSGNSSEEHLIIPQYKPLNLGEDETVGWATTPSKYGPSSSSSSIMTTSAATSNYYSALASHNYAKAAQYARMARGKPLYGAAATVYAENAREALVANRAARSSEAERRVAANSTGSNRYLIDLHGISSTDAKRIASERVRSWWDSLGERQLELSGEGWKTGGRSVELYFVIIVGRGVHSAGNRGVLGPAVKKILEEEGWKISDQQSGQLIVMGRKKK